MDLTPTTTGLLARACRDSNGSLKERFLAQATSPLTQSGVVVAANAHAVAGIVRSTVSHPHEMVGFQQCRIVNVAPHTINHHLTAVTRTLKHHCAEGCLLRTGPAGRPPWSSSMRWAPRTVG